MSFPFSVKYTRRLKVQVPPAEVPKALNYIGKYITEKTAEDVVIEGNELTFKSAFFRFRWNWNVMVPIEKGKFVLTNTGDESILSYEFSMYRLLLIATAGAVFMGIVSQEIWVGVIALLWLGGMNWLITILRHRWMLADIAESIEGK